MNNNLYYQDEYVRQKFNFRMFFRLARQAARHKKTLIFSLLIEMVTGVLSLVPGLLYSVIISAIYIAVVFITDILYTIVDPRIRISGGKK